MTTAMFTALPALLAEATTSATTRLLVLQSATPGLFCAGADIAEMAANAGDGAWRDANQHAINRAQFELARLPIPTIAFVDGDAIGGGCGLALACDLRVATPRARFGITPARLGLVYPFHDTKLLVDLVGAGQARRMLFTGALIDAAEALRIGLVEAVAGSPDAMIAAIVANAPSSVRGAKAMVRRVLDGQVADDAVTMAMFADAFVGADFAEGVRAFLDKRPPAFADLKDGAR